MSKLEDLKKKLAKSTTVTDSTFLSDPEYFKNATLTRMPTITMNLLYSGKWNGGYPPGVTTIAGVSRSMKTIDCLLAMKMYLQTHADAFAIIYNNEFGIKEAYIKAIGIDTSRVIMRDVFDIESLKTDMYNTLKSIENGDKVFFMLDSLGNMATIKELTDAESGKNVADMQRAKAIKSAFRVVSGMLIKYGLPMFVVNHTYQSMDMYPVEVVASGRGVYYISDNIIIKTRNKLKEGDGSVFVYKVEKSRLVKDGVKVYMPISYTNGISKYSGLFDFVIGIEGQKWIDTSTSKGWYIPDGSDKKYRRSDTESPEFWQTLESNPKFIEDIESQFIIDDVSFMSRIEE